MSEDFFHQAQQDNPNATYDESIFNMTLITIEDKIITVGGKKLTDYGLPMPNRNDVNLHDREIAHELSYDTNELDNFVVQHEPMLTDEQKQIYSRVIDQY